MKNVAIICGGFSSEFEISMKSARNIKQNFPKEYNAFLISMNKDGWRAHLDNEEIIPFDEKTFSINTESEEIKMDLALIYIHGDPGENGKIQAYLELIGIPYVNSGPLASELSFDKWFCNQFLARFGYKIAKSKILTSANQLNVDEVVNVLGLPVFVKPCDSGSSYGIARVNEKQGLSEAVSNAFNEGRTVVLESFLDGTEVTCAVYRSKEGVKALPLTEIVSENEFFDYEAKYQGLSQEITPARISDELTEKVQQISKEIYGIMQLKSIARIDYMIVNNEPHIIEVNTIPGFSNESIVPKMIQTAGMTVESLWQEIISVEI